MNNTTKGHYSVSDHRAVNLERNNSRGHLSEVLLIPLFCAAGQRQRVTVTKRTRQV